MSWAACARRSRPSRAAPCTAACKVNGAAFLREVVAAFPYRLRTVLTDNGMAFADLPKNRGRHPEIEAVFRGHTFHPASRRHGIGHKLTRPHHPWTNGQ